MLGKYEKVEVVNTFDDLDKYPAVVKTQHDMIVLTRYKLSRCQIGTLNIKRGRNIKLMKALGFNLMLSAKYWQNCNQNTTADLNEIP